MWCFEEIAERRIAEAIAAGELDDLPGAGKPLPAEDDLLVAPELRMAFRILKNAGFVPPEIELRKQIRRLEALLPELDGQAHEQAMRRLNLMLAGLPGANAALAEQAYRERMVRQMQRRRGEVRKS